MKFDSTNKKIALLEEKILKSKNKKFKPQKLNYSFDSLENFVNEEIMDLHYNTHYKGYIKKLNDEISNYKNYPYNIEKIIRGVSRYNKKVKDNVGGVYNHQIFWKMMTPNEKRISGDILKHIKKDFGSYKEFKDKFKETALSLFGSGWVWLVIDKDKLKIITTPNQINPLMNINKKVTYPLLGLDLWEHAYYLEYKADKKQYIDNFWKVINWDYVNIRLNFYKNGMEYTLQEGILKESKSIRCDSRSIGIYRDLFNRNPQIKNNYKNKINNIMRETFPTYWFEENEKFEGSPFGVYDFEKKGRSVLNKLNTNYTVFCTLVQDINQYLKYQKKPILNFTNKDRNGELKELEKFLNLLDLLKYRIFNTNSDTFKNIYSLIGKLDKQGDKREDRTIKDLKKHFNTDKVFKVGGLGNREDMVKGIDAKINLGGKEETIQIKPFKYFKVDGDKIQIFGTGNVKNYNVDYLVFQNNQKGIKIFDNSETKIINGVYTFPKEKMLK
jgi:Fe-Mn family superoxide dismutase